MSVESTVSNPIFGDRNQGLEMSQWTAIETRSEMSSHTTAAVGNQNSSRLEKYMEIEEKLETIRAQRLEAAQEKKLQHFSNNRCVKRIATELQLLPRFFLHISHILTVLKTVFAGVILVSAILGLHWLGLHVCLCKYYCNDEWKSLFVRTGNGCGESKYGSATYETCDSCKKSCAWNGEGSGISS